MVELLLTHPFIQINKSDNHGEPPLSVALKNGNSRTGEILLKNDKFNIKQAIEDHCDSLLLGASISDRVELVEQLLAHPSIEVNTADSEGRTALLWASYRGHDQVVKLLLDHQNVDVNKADKDGQTPLHGASFRVRPKVVELLLSHPSIRVNQVNKDGQTPMHIAERKGRTEICKLFRRGKVAKKTPC